MNIMQQNEQEAKLDKNLAAIALSFAVFGLLIAIFYVIPTLSPLLVTR